ncbi:FAD-binding domain-containing protein [Sistotremastrum niveocremeum HHB9708]|uniref:FAD-binding domain-containing protein n=1 Tax=Sistotremastrum niveocremeum HHB9708 TaxID=1314777 RepID=A0A164Q113_9AGAM|nr:FAD-binding domain-containing protein [Sistotremastrum niveocremeum HHB9708]
MSRVLTSLFSGLAASSSLQISLAEWNDLNSTVHGRLQQHSPFARPCFKLANTTEGLYDPAKCSAIQGNYLNTFFRSGYSGSYEQGQWEACSATLDRCLLDSNAPFNPEAYSPPNVCGQGSVPDYFVDVHEPADVVAAFKFSRKTGVPVVIKNTGHDYQGRSSRPGSLAIWTNNLKEIRYEQEWKPHGCSKPITPTAAVSVGAGVEFLELYRFGEANNITIPGGACATVGATGGYVQGGGHTALSNVYGLGADRALQFTVVVPSGEVLVANECQNTDLYFALRGGGGGTFGVVLELVTKAFPRTPVIAVTMSGIPTDPDTTREFYKVIVDNSLQWAQEGWGGYIAPSYFQYVNPNASLYDDATDSMEPLREFARAHDVIVSEDEFPSYFAWWAKVPEPVDQISGLSLSLASRLVPAKNFETAESREKLLNVTLDVSKNHPIVYIFSTTPYSYQADNLTSVTPAFRTSLWHFIIGHVWNFDTPLGIQEEMLENLTDEMDKMRDITPGSGAYINESDLHEPDFEFSYWGEHYDGLVEIKNKYDPDHLLDCWHCVGFRGAKHPDYRCYV